MEAIAMQLAHLGAMLTDMRGTITSTVKEALKTTVPELQTFIREEVTSKVSTFEDYVKSSLALDALATAKDSLSLRLLKGPARASLRRARLHLVLSRAIRVMLRLTYSRLRVGIPLILRLLA